MRELDGEGLLVSSVMWPCQVDLEPSACLLSVFQGVVAHVDGQAPLVVSHYLGVGWGGSRGGASERASKEGLEKSSRKRPSLG